MLSCKSRISDIASIVPVHPLAQLYKLTDPVSTIRVFANGHNLDLTKSLPPVTADRCPLTAQATKVGLFFGRSTVGSRRSGSQKVASPANSRSNSKGVR